ncbi:MAG: Wzz/FepE/Etk N-terminal domain-containing protein [Bacteroidota bacterium]|jgi:capsule polysaccharide export protein KpsE/RkpR
MAELKGVDFLDFLLFLIDKKRLIVYVFLSSLIFSYGLIYFFIEEQYEATAIIIPSEDDGVSGISGMLKGLKNLPLGIGASSTKSSVNRYNTIIYSRTSLEHLIDQFDLLNVYKINKNKIDARELAIKELKKNIITNETKDDAFEITVRANSAKLASDMTNNIIQYLNKSIIDLKISKSRENRIFLEKRVSDIYKDLHASEDSLKIFQEKSGLYDIKSQLPELFTLYSRLETELLTKQIQKSILEKLYDNENQELKNITVEINEFEKKIDKLKSGGEAGSLVLPLINLPQKSVDYLRKYRSIEINNAILEFIVPLYEQAKIEEKKDYPILQVIDYAVPPAKKSWPPRVLFALLASLFTTTLLLAYSLVRGISKKTTNPKMILLREKLPNLFSFRSK